MNESSEKVIERALEIIRTQFETIYEKGYNDCKEKYDALLKQVLLDKEERNMTNYESIDISDLNFEEPISSKKALADVTPIEWDNSVINGKNKIIVRSDEYKEKE